MGNENFIKDLKYKNNMVSEETKMIIYWIVGSVLIFMGVVLGGAVDPSALGSTTLGTVVSYLISFFLILFGGMFWISAAMYYTEEHEEHEHE